MLLKKMIPLSLFTVALLNAAEAELSTINVESTVITEVSQNAQISADLAQALSSSVPSIDMNRRSGIANDIYIRGQKRDNISVDVDGTKIQGACINRMDPPISHILTNQINEVEVIEGPYDVENFGTLSGGVKITTKKPTKDLNAEINLGYGSWSYKKAGISFSGGTDLIRLLVSASYETSEQYEDGNGDTIAQQIDNYATTSNLVGTTKDPRLQPAYYDMDAYTKKSVMTKAFITTAKDQELRLSYTANRSDDVIYGNSKMDALYDDSNIYSVEYNIDNINNVYKNINLQYYYSDVDHPMGTDYRMSSINTGGAVFRNWLTTSMEGVKIKSTFDINSYKILLGLDTSKKTWDGMYYKNGVALMGGRKSIDNAETKNNAVFAKLEKTFGSLNVSVGARYDSTDIDNDSYQSNNYSAISANILTTYNLDEKNKLFLGVGQASRVPDARELYFLNSMGKLVGTPNLEQTKNSEIDLGYEASYDSFNFKIKGFYSILDDYIYYQKDADNNPTTPDTNAFKNIDATIYGTEITASYYASDDITIDAGLSYKNGEKDEALAGQTDKDLADITPLRGNLALNYDYAPQSAATVEVQASDKWTDIDSDNGEQELDSWAVLNLKLKHHINKNTDITFGVNNLFDETYAVNNTYADLVLISAGGSSNVMLMNEPGRYIYTNLTFRF